jgi:hypothetical protein
MEFHGAQRSDGRIGLVNLVGNWISYWSPYARSLSR